MSVSYIIRPLDDEMKEIFNKFNKSYPDAASRMPTRDDIKKVLYKLGQSDSSLSHLYIGPSKSLSPSDPAIYSTLNERSISILRYREADERGGPFMTFLGGYMDVVGPIVKELSRVCGALVVLIDLPDAFDIITPETDIFEKFEGWM
jgi:hypothetical protein